MASYDNEIRLSTFTQNVGDLARANRFIVTFTGSGAGNIPITQKYFVKTAQLPGRTLGDLPPLYWQGLQDKRAGDPTYEDLTLTFHNDLNFTIKKWTEEWMEMIAGGVTNIRGAKSDYQAEVKIEQLGQGAAVVATYLYKNVYPKALTAVDLSSDSADTTTELSVTYNCDVWTGAPDNQMAVGVYEEPTT